jgi:NAD(P)H-hydrate repair Nnr-like enzyme with NAD(P)H-hydrate epimerase domain
MLIAGGVVVSALAACGTETIDDGEVEEFLRDNAQAPSLIESVDCPSDVEVDDGDTFDCEVHTKGDGLEVTTIRQLGDGDIEAQGTRQVRLPQGEDVKIIPENVEALIRANAPEPERIVSVDCPAGIEIEKGATFRCVVRFDDGTQERVAIVQRDDVGNVEIKP